MLYGRRHLAGVRGAFSIRPQLLRSTRGHLRAVPIQLWAIANAAWLIHSFEATCCPHDPAVHLIPSLVGGSKASAFALAIILGVLVLWSIAASRRPRGYRDAWAQAGVGAAVTLVWIPGLWYGLFRILAEF